MNRHKLSFHVKKFSDSIRVMNDTNAKSMTMTATDAKNLHTDIFALLAKIAELSEKQNTEENTGPYMVMDAGKF
jgi:hypothetical protein